MWYYSLAQSEHVCHRQRCASVYYIIRDNKNWAYWWHSEKKDVVAKPMHNAQRSQQSTTSMLVYSTHHKHWLWTNSTLDNYMSSADRHCAEQGKKVWSQKYYNVLQQLADVKIQRSSNSNTLFQICSALASDIFHSSKYINSFYTDFQCFGIWLSLHTIWNESMPRYEECTWCYLHGRLHWIIIQLNVILQHFIETFFTVNKSTTTNQCPRNASSQTF